MTRLTFREIVDDAKALLAADDLSPTEREELTAFLAEVGNRSEYDITAYDYFTEHMPEDDADLALVVLKGHLLIEQRVRAFVEARLLKPEALGQARLSSHQLICLAESLCLPNPEPAWLWEMVRKLNSLRNSLVHELTPVDIQDRINAFLAAYHEKHPIHGKLTGCLGNLYAQVTELARVAAEEPEFRVRGNGSRVTRARSAPRD